MSARWKVLVSAPYLLPVLEEYRGALEAHGAELVIPPVEERLEEDELLRWIEGVHGVICGDDRFTRRVLEAASDLRVISKWGTGIDSIDGEAAAELGIRVRNTPDAFTDPVADSALGLALAFSRNIARGDARMKAGRWEKLPGRSLSECTFGVVGVGRIGEAVLHRAGAFGATLLGNDVREISPSVRSRLRVEMTSLESLLERSDFVSLHCDLNLTSHHLIDSAALARMKAGAVLINTARGPIVHEEALVEALDAGPLGGAGLDVFEVEPLPASSPLRRREDVLLSAHNTNSSPSAARRVHENTIRQLFEVLEERG